MRFSVGRAPKIVDGVPHLSWIRRNTAILRWKSVAIANGHGTIPRDIAWADGSARTEASNRRFVHSKQ
jgi:hypothetical protein